MTPHRPAARTAVLRRARDAAVWIIEPVAFAAVISAIFMAAIAAGWM